MSAINDGGPAFPVPLLPGESWDDEKNGNPNGMTLRDWFAGMAFQAMISKTPFVRRNPDWKETMNQAAYSAYGYADAMIAARERKEAE